MTNQPIDPDGPIAASARAAARRLQPDHGAMLATDVEAAIHTANASRRSDQYFDPISLGSLIVSVANLAWTVYQGLRHNTANPSPHVIQRTVRLELPAADQISTAERDKVIQIVVDEIIKQADE